MKKTLHLSTGILALLLFSAGISSAQKNKFLEGKKYKVQFYEVKAAGRGKAVESNFTIKGGTVESDLMEDKISLPEAKYHVMLDSTYTEDDTPMRMMTIEADYQEGKDEFHWEATITNYDVEGTVTQSKSGVEKKKFEFAGTEKTKK